MRTRPLELDPEDFRVLGHRLVDRLATFLAELPSRPVTSGETAAALRERLGRGTLPDHGVEPQVILDEASDLLIAHSLFNGHPRFMAYITSSAAPIGALADLLASTVNPNCGSFLLAPVGTLVEEQSVRWIVDLLGLPPTAGGILVSGGNMANFVAYWAARVAGAGRDVRAEGITGAHPRLTAYCSSETHTWIQKAADLSGLGTDELRWIPVDAERRLDMGQLKTRVAADRAAGHRPFIVVGTAGTVSTGSIDPLREMRDFCRTEGIWFHVDGAYGAPAAIVRGAPPDLGAIADADSVAIDPHKWLYAPLEVGCALVRDPSALHATFGYHPTYLQFETTEEDPAPNYFELGPQNSRGLRALKVWMGLRQAGREGLATMIGDDIRLARELFELAGTHPELEAVSHGLSITTFRYVPPHLDRAAADQSALNALNARVLDALQRSGRAFVSNALVDGRFVLRACIVNFRTERPDLQALIEAVVDIGRRLTHAH